MNASSTVKVNKNKTDCNGWFTFSLHCFNTLIIRICVQIFKDFMGNLISEKQKESSSLLTKAERIFFIKISITERNFKAL